MSDVLRRVYWLASYPKSGNTWARLMLAAYRWKVDEVDLLLNQEITLLDIQQYAYQVVAPVPLADMNDQQQLFIRPAALLHLIAKAIHLPIIFKTHNANIIVLGIPLIPDPLTEAAIYIVRDPRDVCLSYAAHIDKSHEHTANIMNETGHRLLVPKTGLCHWLTTWSNHVKGWTEDGNFERTVIRYEDMHRDPVQALEMMLVRTGIQLPDPLRVRKAVEATRFDRLQEQEHKRGFIEQAKNGGAFFRSGQIGEWEYKLDLKLITKIEQDHKDMMRKYNYEPYTAKAA